MSVRFRFDWVDTGPSPDALARDTMAALTIEAGNATVTSVLDRRNRVYRSHVVTPLFSVAEWLVSNWWHIWCEIEDAGAQRPDFESRHNLAFAGDGYVLPSLTMVPMSGRMQLRWTKRRPRHAGIEFVDSGEQDVEHDALDAELRGLIDAVLERLRESVGRRGGMPGLWLLLAGDQQATLEGRAVPVLSPGQRVRVPDLWLQ